MHVFPRVSIIIVNTNELHHLKRCLPSICNQNYIDYEVIIVDNDSIDNSVPYIRCQFPQVRVILSSGFTPDAELDKLKGMGLAGFIPKPYQLNELSQVVASALHPFD